MFVNCSCCSLNLVQNPQFSSSSGWTMIMGGASESVPTTCSNDESVQYVQSPNSVTQIFGSYVLAFSYKPLGSVSVTQTISLQGCSAQDYIFSSTVAALYANSASGTPSKFSATASFYDSASNLIQTIGASSVSIPMDGSFLNPKVYSWRSTQNLQTAVRAVITLQGVDGKYWAGCYGPCFGNISLVSVCAAGAAPGSSDTASSGTASSGTASTNSSSNVGPSSSSAQKNSISFYDIVSQHWESLGTTFDITASGGGQPTNNALVDFSALKPFLQSWNGQISSSMTQPMIDLSTDNFFTCTNSTVTGSSVNSNSLSLSGGGENASFLAHGFAPYLTTNVLSSSSRC